MEERFHFVIISYNNVPIRRNIGRLKDEGTANSVINVKKNKTI